MNYPRYKIGDTLVTFGGEKFTVYDKGNNHYYGRDENGRHINRYITAIAYREGDKVERRCIRIGPYTYSLPEKKRFSLQVVYFRKGKIISCEGIDINLLDEYEVIG